MHSKGNGIYGYSMGGITKVFKRMGFLLHIYSPVCRPGEMRRRKEKKNCEREIKIIAYLRVY